MKTFCPSLLILLLSATLGLLATPLVRAQNDQTIKALEDEMPRLLEQGNVPGLSIAVIRNGELFWSGAFGVKSLETKEPVDTQTIFEAASLSKPVFAYAVLRLAERGEIDLDTPLADHLPYERLEHEARYRQITARIVMSHSTGLPNWGGDRLHLNFDPGTAFNYSGEGFVYLQKTIEHLTGLTLDEVARREVFEPLGMTRSSYL
ncbi:MAG: beta-lactamase family protein, partial [Bacteroidetes bacterium]|nr:beta-lactamase family protein [Bacteroidota bacterium]